MSEPTYKEVYEELLRLRKEAEQMSRQRGHILDDWVIDLSNNGATATTECTTCCCFVQIKTHPLPNEASIGGNAIALVCVDDEDEDEDDDDWEEEDEEDDDCDDVGLTPAIPGSTLDIVRQVNCGYACSKWEKWAKENPNLEVFWNTTTDAKRMILIVGKLFGMARPFRSDTTADDIRKQFAYSEIAEALKKRGVKLVYGESI